MTININKLEIVCTDEGCIAKAEGFSGVMLTCPRCQALLPREGEEHRCGDRLAPTVKISQMTESELIRILSATYSIPFGDRTGRRHRTIYESGVGAKLKPSGHFYMDFATYGGTTEEVPKSLIDRLEKEGKLVRAFADRPEINAWTLPGEKQAAK